MPDKVELKKGSVGTLSQAEVPSTTLSHEIASIPTSSINENSRIGGRSRGMKV